FLNLVAARLGALEEPSSRERYPELAAYLAHEEVDDFAVAWHRGINPRLGVREPRVLRSLTDEGTPVLPQMRHEGVSLHALRDEADLQPFDLPSRPVELPRAGEGKFTQGGFQDGSGPAVAVLLVVDLMV